MKHDKAIFLTVFADYVKNNSVENIGKLLIQWFEQDTPNLTINIMIEELMAKFPESKLIRVKILQSLAYYFDYRN